MLPLVSHGANLFNLCPWFPDSSALYVQNWFPIRPAVWPQFPSLLKSHKTTHNAALQGMNPQTCTKFGANRSSRLTASPDFWMCDPLTPPPPTRHAPWGIEGWLVFSLCPFPDEYADVNQSWSQSVQPFESFPWLLNLRPPKTPQVPPCVSQGNLFGVYPFPDESAHVYQIWCQLDQPFDIFPWLLNLWPLPPPPPPMSRGELYLAYVHSQTNPQTCSKFVANRSSRLTASQDFWICDPLKPPEMPPCVL